MWVQHKTFFSTLRKERLVSRNVRLRSNCVQDSEQWKKRTLWRYVPLCCDVPWRVSWLHCSCTPVSSLQSHDVLLHTASRCSSFTSTHKQARTVHRASVDGRVEVPPVKFVQGWREMLGSKLLTGSPAIPMSFPSVHPRRNLFTIYWLYDFINQMRRWIKTTKISWLQASTAV